MVDRWREAADAAGLEEKAAELGKTPAELMTIASLIEAEGRGDDMPKISRVIFNRLDGPGDKGGTNGLLQIDASVNYGLDQELGVALTTEQLAAGHALQHLHATPDSRRRRSRLAGDAAIAAAANPAEGDWYYYVTVDLATGETKFAETYDEFLSLQGRVHGVLHHLRRLLMSGPEASGRRCGVLGDPIAHSLSPALHRAGYAALGLDWTYDAHRVGVRRAARTSSSGSDGSGAGCR